MWNPHFVILTLDFDYAGRPCGGRINNYLLEKSRVVGQLKMERNFHVFYQLCKGAEGKLRESCKIESCDQFRYLARSGCFDVEGMDDVAEYEATRRAMSHVGLSNKACGPNPVPEPNLNPHKDPNHRPSTLFSSWWLRSCTWATSSSK